MTQLVSICAALALFAGLILSTPLPEVANIIGLTLLGVAMICLIWDRQARSIAMQPQFLLVYGGFLLLLLALTPTATSIEHIVAIMIVAPVWLAGPYSGLIARAPYWLLKPFAIGVLALAGTLASTLVAGYDVLVLGMVRGGFSVNNPIHLADLAVSLGFLSLVGLFACTPWRFVVLLGPLLALATVLFTGSRGPFLAFCLLAMVAAGYVIFAIRRPSRLMVVAVIVVLGGIGLSTPFVTFNLNGREFQLAESVSGMLTGQGADTSNNERSAMLQMAWGAFEASPLFGHGLIDYTIKAAQFAPPGNPPVLMGHLHNDIANFSVIGGVLGLMTYLALLSAPLVAAWRNRGEQRSVVWFIALMASAGYFAMGLTNAMLGILTQTVLYGLMLALTGVFTHRSRS